MNDPYNSIDESGGARLRDLTRDGDLGPFVDSLVRPIEAQRDAYREIAIEKEMALRDAARRDVEAEATRRQKRNGAHLRAV
ncbi:hypothetical protein KDN32_20810 [Nocardioides sp. J2M5]|uniref:hypothetical protein n=1 Tax=Nocardioides palaemonis TaxID=2829810 RepID=UPI001BA61381|nr:hypothetical protein [Nocardioides palaemonis]MBS2940185.1 hypothetical protein [Nocardioides palaemonis]